jgi:cytochrome b561
MRWKSTTERYGAVAIAIHWISAILIIALIISGFRIANIADAGAKAPLLRLHAMAGISILILTLARIVWWYFADDKPLPVGGTPALQRRLAGAVHALFYVVILGMVASGIGMMVLSGAGAILFANAPGLLPDFWNYPPRIPHGIGGRLLAALLVLHVGAAFYHHFVRRDRLLARIGISR